MSNILIITDQPVYDHCSNRIAGPSISVTSVFSGDIVDGKLETMNLVKGARYDSILVAKTIFPHSEYLGKILDVLDSLKEKDDDLKVHFYANKY